MGAENSASLSSPEVLQSSPSLCSISESLKLDMDSSCSEETNSKSSERLGESKLSALLSSCSRVLDWLDKKWMASWSVLHPGLFHLLARDWSGSKSPARTISMIPSRAWSTGDCASLLYSNADFEPGSTWYPARRRRDSSQLHFAIQLSIDALREWVPIEDNGTRSSTLDSSSRSQTVAWGGSRGTNPQPPPANGTGIVGNPGPTVNFAACLFSNHGVAQSPTSPGMQQAAGNNLFAIRCLPAFLWWYSSHSKNPAPSCRSSHGSAWQCWPSDHLSLAWRIKHT